MNDLMDSILAEFDELWSVWSAIDNRTKPGIRRKRIFKTFIQLACKRYCKVVCEEVIAVGESKQIDAVRTEVVLEQRQKLSEILKESEK